jgi:hypothetical protein
MGREQSPEYDFDEMAKAFGIMRASFRAYQKKRGDRQLDDFLHSASRFFDGYPNPFESAADDAFLPGSRVIPEVGISAPSMDRLRQNEKVLIQKLEHLVKVQAGAEEYERWETLLHETRKKLLKMASV